ncbi:conjugal transfer protein [Streptomyces sp. NBC_00555]|uniref:conjugal transfer protein n=1 Tax=Streptomyces sp. NBC_00555 TaxID=2903662 RepID=UPI0022545AC4|nr:conjugal transfer protein [Streptomyces sp. NBC_00555]MCX5014780.1 conjugal transfer protein [Streptomyces sp. NBC_00555]
MSIGGKGLSRPQKAVLSAAFVPMVATGVAGGFGTYSNISAAYGSGTALGAVAAGEGATAVLALVLLGLTMLGQSSPGVIRAGLWALPAAAAVMSAMAATDPGETVIYALTPMGMTTAAEGAAFLARRIVVHRDGRDAEADRKAAAVVQALAYRQAMAASHPDEKVRRKSELAAWKLAGKVGTGDLALSEQLLEVQRARITAGADCALAAMFSGSATPARPAEAIAPTVELEVDRSTESIHSVNPNEAEQIGTERSTSEQPLKALEPAPVTPDPVRTEEAPQPPAAVSVESADRPVVRAVAADGPVRRRATGRVPEIARTSVPRRTREELLAEARQLTESWPTEHVTGDRIRKALRTSPVNARWLRETLRAERDTTTG